MERNGRGRHRDLYRHLQAEGRRHRGAVSRPGEGVDTRRANDVRTPRSAGACPIPPATSIAGAFASGGFRFFLQRRPQPRHPAGLFLCLDRPMPYARHAEDLRHAVHNIAKLGRATPGREAAFYSHLQTLKHLADMLEGKVVIAPPAPEAPAPIELNKKHKKLVMRDGNVLEIDFGKGKRSAR